MARRWGRVVTVQKASGRYRDLMGLRCCWLSHQAAPHLSPPPDQQPDSAPHATHIHLLVDFFFFSRLHTSLPDGFEYCAFILFHSRISFAAPFPFWFRTALAGYRNPTLILRRLFISRFLFSSLQSLYTGSCGSKGKQETSQSDRPYTYRMLASIPWWAFSLETNIGLILISWCCRETNIK